MNRSTRNINVNAGPRRGGARSFGRVFDNFVAPAQSRSGLHSLAKSLGLAGEAFQSVEIKRKNEEAAAQERADARRGELDGIAASMMTDPAQIRQGTMFPQQSAAYNAAYKESWGQASATLTVKNWETEWGNWDKRDSNDPNDFTEFLQRRVSDFRREYGQDEYVMAGANPVLTRGLTSMSAKHAEYTGERMKREDMESMQIISLDLMERQDWEQDPTGSMLIQNLAFQADVRVQRGLNGTEVNQTLIEDVLSFANTHNDPRYLQALAAGHDSGAFRLSAAQQELITEEALNIESELDEIARDNEAVQAKMEKQERERQLNGYLQELQADPMAMPPAEWSADMAKTALGLRKAINQAKDYVDPAKEAQALVGVNALLYSEDFQKLSYDEKLAQITPLLTDPSNQFTEATINGIMRKVAGKTDPNSVFNNPTLSRLYDNTVRMVTTLGYEKETFGERNQLVAAFRSAYDSIALETGPLEGKSVAEITEIHKTIVNQVMQDLLSIPDVKGNFVTLLENKDNAAIMHQFGLKDYLDEHNQRAQSQADEELANILGE